MDTTVLVDPEFIEPPRRGSQSLGPAQRYLLARLAREEQDDSSGDDPSVVEPQRDAA